MNNLRCGSCANFRTTIGTSDVTNLPKSAHTYCIDDRMPDIDENTPACLLHPLNTSLTNVAESIAPELSSTFIGHTLQDFVRNPNDLASMTYTSLIDAMNTILNRAEIKSEKVIESALVRFVIGIEEACSVMYMTHISELKKEIETLKREVEVLQMK